jgi:hypothetical protein
MKILNEWCCTLLILWIINLRLFLLIENYEHRFHIAVINSEVSTTCLMLCLDAIRVWLVGCMMIKINSLCSINSGVSKQLIMLIVFMSSWSDMRTLINKKEEGYSLWTWGSIVREDSNCRRRRWNSYMPDTRYWKTQYLVSDFSSCLITRTNSTWYIN